MRIQFLLAAADRLVRFATPASPAANASAALVPATPLLDVPDALLRTEARHSELVHAARQSYDLYAIGDTHGDWTYFTQCMMATGLFTLEAAAAGPGAGVGGRVAPRTERLVWRADPLHRAQALRMVGIELWHVYVLGDMIDRGTQSLRILRTLQALEEQWPFGLTVLLGNHEAMLLLGEEHAYVHEDDDFPPALRKDALSYATPEVRARDPRSWRTALSHHMQLDAYHQEVREVAKTLRWLRRRPVVALDPRTQTLLAHGGVASGVEGSVAEMNLRSQRALLMAQALHQRGVFGRELLGRLEQTDGYDIVGPGDMDPLGLDPRTGPLWYRGFSTSATDQQISSAFGIRCDREELVARLRDEAARLGRATEPLGRFPLPPERVLKLLAPTADFAEHEQLLVYADVTVGEYKLRGGQAVLVPLSGAEQVALDAVPTRPGVGTGDPAFPGGANCLLAQHVAGSLGAARMVVGHTVHPHVTKYCAKAVPVFQVDTHPDEECSVDSCSYEQTFEDGEPVAHQRPFALRLRFRPKEPVQELGCFAERDLQPWLRGALRLDYQVHCAEQWIAQPAGHLKDGSLGAPPPRLRRPPSSWPVVVPRSDEGRECDWGASWDFYDLRLLAVTPGGLLDHANQRADKPCLPGHRVVKYELSLGGPQVQVTRGFVRNLGPVTLHCAAADLLDLGALDRAEGRSYGRLAAELHAARRDVDAALEAS